MMVIVMGTGTATAGTLGKATPGIATPGTATPGIATLVIAIWVTAVGRGTAVPTAGTIIPGAIAPMGTGAVDISGASGGVNPGTCTTATSGASAGTASLFTI
jgi:hypothetical protein